MKTSKNINFPMPIDIVNTQVLVKIKQYSQSRPRVKVINENDCCAQQFVAGSVLEINSKLSV